MVVLPCCAEGPAIHDIPRARKGISRFQTLRGLTVFMMWDCAAVVLGEQTSCM